MDSTKLDFGSPAATKKNLFSSSGSLFSLRRAYKTLGTLPELLRSVPLRNLSKHEGKQLQKKLMKGPSLFAFLPSSPPPRPLHCLESLLSFKHFPSSYFPQVSCLSRTLHVRKGREKILQKSHPGPVLIFPRIRTQKEGVGTEKTNFRLRQHVESKKSERL